MTEIVEPSFQDAWTFVWFFLIFLGFKYPLQMLLFLSFTGFVAFGISAMGSAMGE